MNKERFEAFTDAVIAIIMTILVLDIHLPTDDHSMRAIIAIAPSFLACIVSFTILAVMWVNHHNLFLHVKTVNHKILYTNIFLLFWQLYYQLPQPGLVQTSTHQRQLGCTLSTSLFTTFLSQW